MNKVNIYNEVEESNFIDAEFVNSINLKQPCGNIHFNSCQLCKQVDLDPIDISHETGRLIKVKVCLKNVCVGREITVGCLLLDRNDKVIAMKSATFSVNKEKCISNGEDSLIANSNDKCKPTCSPCVNVNRTFYFILPNNNICSPMEIKAKTIANYTSPCS